MGQASGKALEPTWNCCEVLVDAAADVIFSRNLAGDGPCPKAPEDYFLIRLHICLNIAVKVGFYIE